MQNGDPGYPRAGYGARPPMGGRQIVRSQREPQDIDPAKIRAALIPDITPFRIGLFATWIIGILLMNNAPAPYTPPLEDLDRYDQLQASADTMFQAIAAEKEYWAAAAMMQQAQASHHITTL